MTEEISSAQAYTEACSMLRHYSNASLTVRITSIVQGIALLVVWAYVFIRDQSQYAITVPIAGFLFTWLLYRFHQGYFRATQFFYETASQIEELFASKDCRPLSKYMVANRDMHSNLWSIFLTINVPFTLIGCLFLIAFIASILRLFS